MPEIAEVQTVRKVLKRRVLKRKIKNVNIIYNKIIENDIDDFKKKIIGKEFDDIDRRGKWLLFSIGDYYLCSHLRMEGKYFVKEHNEPIEKHEHVIFEFEDGLDLRYADVRKFGRMCLVEKSKIEEYEPVHKQGIEPIDDKLSGEYIYEHFKDKKIPIKTLLLDQTIIAGLGNIYADEVAHRAKVNPLKLGTDIKLIECKRIKEAAKEIIEKAIEYGGTTIRSYTSSLGVTGSYQDFLEVHTKEGEKCPQCGTIIKKEKVGGRSTYYCPKCQK